MTAHESERPIAFDASGLSLSWKTAITVLGVLTSIVILIVTLFPFLFSKNIAIATQEYVDSRVGEQDAQRTEEVAGIKVQITELTNQVGRSSRAVSRIEDALTKQRASQEAERVTTSIKLSSERVQVYQRVYEANLKRLSSGEEPVTPGEIINFQ